MNHNRTDISEDQGLLSAFHTYMDSYFLRRDEQECLALMSENLCGFGTGSEEFALDPAAVRRMYHRDFTEAQEPITVIYDFIHTQHLDEANGIITARASIATTIDRQPIVIHGLRFSLVFSKTTGEWKLVHIHVSVPNDQQSSDESYPVKQLREQNQQLLEQISVKARELQKNQKNLEGSLKQVTELRRLLPICARCKKIRDDSGYWHQVEEYLLNNSDISFSHGLCPECAEIYLKELKDS